MTDYQGIKGLDGREPVGAVLRVGKKGPKGYPVERDRLYIASRHENEQGVRPLLEDFAKFNELPPEHRRAFRAYLVHPAQSDVWSYRLSGRVLKGWQVPAHPNKRPVCEGDGEKATRLFSIGDDGTEDWREIECPNELCEFRQSKQCKPWAKVFFQPRWREGWADRLPSPLMMLTTQSWNSVANFKGFFEHVEELAAELHLERWSYVGMPVIFRLGERKDKKKGHVFPVLDLSVDGSLVDFFAAQIQRISAAGGHLELPEHTGARDESEAAIDLDAKDYADITPGVPGEQGSLI